MATLNTLLQTSTNASIQKGGAVDDAPMENFPTKSSLRYNAVTQSFEHNVNTERPTQLLDHHIDPILRLRQTNVNDNGTSMLNLLLLPSLQEHSHVGNLPDSHPGIKNSCAATPGGGETVKIRSELKTCGPLMTLVHVLRESWNETNLPCIAPHHKNQILLVSHNSSSKEQSHQNMASTMTAHPFSTEYLPSRQMNLINSTRGHYPSRSRIRSRSIAIKRPTKEEQMEEIRQNSLAAEYDWATWRMYNRIIEHRQKHPLPYVDEDNSASSEATSSAFINVEGPDSSSFPIVSDDENQSLDEEKPQQHYPEYGEVFDLDL